ncbi:GNAT family acetyltransferase [Clostridium sporogenes]|uniref:GNAT family N-acetyltransferase n=1 Tax=Clostridium botulinum TaxID=1491 RepID=UPI0007178B17|nr:GNAT family N-acetyltransferase [Clostridium botulinum]KRU28219.1 GNAT family acetyltransferase [Clostridium sporogenes]KRU31017.1 GNAT family acetyltransferase [Clostridium sporogenes]KRU34408.1 GNAT family acetyltransferase [Clostridium sporogenes]KRU47263.1 GNAT family acetyltransferase [Clostridium sporogenes]MBZ1330909.1 GNAT family N-acetyltransferase [Clostridium botulinum]
MNYRLLERSELELLGEIDRKEIVNEVYYFRDNKLEIVNEFYNIEGWDLKELHEYIDRLKDIYGRNGTIYGAFDNKTLVGLGALESKFIGRNNDQLKLDMLYISNNYRKKGIGKNLVNLLSKKAKELNAKSMYISATPFRNTVEFYFAIGAKLTNEINKDLYKLEPYDIHMVLQL